MSLAGTGPRSVFERYNIVSDGHLASVARRLTGQLGNARVDAERQDALSK
jgi:hypothetical protein